jgi:hypothetical protein
MGRQPEAGARPLLGQRPRPVSDNDVKEEEEKQKGRNMGVYGALVFTQVRPLALAVVRRLRNHHH